jgi:UPF0271 protein
VLSIDLNCDMGEGMPTDDSIFPLISSANIACGGHTGDADSMRRSIEQAVSHSVVIGAHPSYPDRTGFGRTDILESTAGKADGTFGFHSLLPALTDQIGHLESICREMGTRLHHVKPHGALYNRAARDRTVGGIIVTAMRAIDPSLILYGLSGSLLQSAALEAGSRFVSEVFADRSYRADGSLTPRSEPNALLHDPATMLRQVLTIIRRGEVRAAGGVLVRLRAETICLHGDGPDAARFAALIRIELDRNGITVTAPI